MHSHPRAKQSAKGPRHRFVGINTGRKVMRVIIGIGLHREVLPSALVLDGEATRLGRLKDPLRMQPSVRCNWIVVDG